ncbi:MULTISPECIES: CBS domain-containing protein [Nocardia]|uniref:CBS domain-containing protein n=2 Tax=Nocardia TaxID=1817 RepID=A0A2T2YUQ8_9NOCA|nr:MULTISPECIES: CBS domain-containing protein [Nocardia]MBF6244607.1 CBS domain-containing protein [Nocardia elegans]MBF6451669.1 CBS domain-containing protein [Nocardia elegans]PSR59226.1 CBS domain-containing protein [Nocardia nova]
MTTAKQIMHEGAAWVSRTDTVEHAARLMRRLDVGVLPVSDENERLCGIITDRDIVVKCLATGGDPATATCASLCEGTPRWVDADADVHDVLHELEERRIKRLPVIENKRLVGMISEADIARHLSDDEIAKFVEGVYAGT